MLTKHHCTQVLVTLLTFCLFAMHCHATTVGQRYTLVHNFSELAEGEEFILVSPYYKQTVGAYGTTSSTHRFDDAQISFDGETATITDASTTAFVYTTKTRTVSKKEVRYTLVKTADTGEYIYYATQSATNNVWKTSSLSSTQYDYANCSFVFSSDNTVSIEITSKSKHLYFGFNNKDNNRCIWYFKDRKSVV